MAGQGCSYLQACALAQEIRASCLSKDEPPLEPADGNGVMRFLVAGSQQRRQVLHLSGQDTDYCKPVCAPHRPLPQESLFAEPLQNQGRRLLTSFYTDPDTNYQSSTLVDVDTTYKSRSYTTETQRAKVARYAQAAAVAAAGQIPDMNSTLAMEQVGSNNSALMDSYAQKMTDAASSASNTSTADTTAATAAVASTESVATAAVASTESVKPLQESTQQSPESPAQGFLHLTSFKDWVNETASEVGDAVSGAAKKVEEKVKGSPSPSPTPSPSTAAVAAVQSAHSQLYHRGAHTAKVTSSDAIGGKSPWNLWYHMLHLPLSWAGRMYDRHG